MRLFTSLCTVALCSFSTVAAKSAWGFEDATVSLNTKQESGVKHHKEILDSKKPLQSPIHLTPSDAIRVSLTTTENGKGKKPHQAFLVLTEPSTGLEEAFLMTVKGSGKGGVGIAQKDIPLQLLSSPTPLRASVIIASFGPSTPLRTHLFDLDVPQDGSSSAKAPAPLRYGKLPEIHHIFGQDPRSPPVFITAIFGCLVFVALPVLVGVWMELGMNLNHLPQAFSTAPIAHGLFYGSILVLEFIFGLYYLRLTLFQTLPAVGVVGTVAFLSGSRALSEVQARRLAGKR